MTAPVIAPAILASALVLGLALPTVAPAQAAIECATANHPLDKLVCADAGLAAANTDIDRALRAARADLSADGQAALRAGQASWRALVRQLCLGRVPQDSRALDGEARNCLAREFDSRASQIEHAVRTIGPFRFIAVERFTATPSGDHARPFATAEISYPRIDNAATAEARRWNQWIAGLILGLDRADAQTDVLVGFTVHHAATDLIATEISSFAYGHGAAHGMGDFRFANYLLGAGRELAAADLFAVDRSWREFLTRRCHDDLSQRAARGEIGLFTDLKPDHVAPGATDPARWRIGADGLTVQFALYEVAPYAEGMPKVTVGWDELKPYLAESLPFAPPK